VRRGCGIRCWVNAEAVERGRVGGRSQWMIGRCNGSAGDGGVAVDSGVRVVWELARGGHAERVCYSTNRAEPKRVNDGRYTFGAICLILCLGFGAIIQTLTLVRKRWCGSLVLPHLPKLAFVSHSSKKDFGQQQLSSFCSP